MVSILFGVMNELGNKGGGCVHKATHEDSYNDENGKLYVAFMFPHYKALKKQKSSDMTQFPDETNSVYACCPWTFSPLPPSLGQCRDGPHL